MLDNHATRGFTTFQSKMWRTAFQRLPLLSGIGGPSLKKSAEEFVLRILCPNDKIGSVIGKGDYIIKKLRQETGANIKVEDAVPEAEEPVIVVSSTEYADDRISPTVEAVVQLQGKTSENTEKEGVISTRFLIPSRQIGCLLGKGGNIVAKMRKKTRANIRISPKEDRPECASENEELVQILLHASNGRSINGKLLMSASEQKSINGKILSIHGKMLHSGNQSSIQEKLLHASDQRNMHGKLSHVGGLESHFSVQRKTGGKIVQQHQSAESLQEGHYSKDRMKGPGISQKENPGHSDTRLPSTKNLYVGMEKQHVLCMAADLKASSLINGLQKLNCRKSNYPETGRESNEPEADRVGRKLNEPRVSQPGRQSNEPEARKGSNEPEGCRVLSDPQVGQTVRKFNESKAGRKFDEPQEAQAGRELIELKEMSNEPEAGGNCNEQSLGQTSRKADEQQEGRQSTEAVSDRKCSDLQEGQTGRESDEPQESRGYLST